MLDLNRSTLIETHQNAVASGIVRLDEGMAMVSVLENGKLKAKPSTGAAGEFYLGTSISRAAMPLAAPRAETLLIPASGALTVNLGRVPNGVVGATVIVDANTRTTLTVAGSADATHFARSGQVVTFHSSFAGKAVQMRYTYDISAKEALMLYGFDAFTAVDLALAPVIGIVRVGTIFTSCYDPLVDWDSVGGSNVIKLANNGIYTIGGSGTQIDATVFETPSANSNGMLGLLINV